MTIPLYFPYISFTHTDRQTDRERERERQTEQRNCQGNVQEACRNYEENVTEW